MNLLIVGASSLIGRALARRMAPRTQVILADREAAAVQSLADELKGAAHGARGYGVDVSCKDSVTEMFARIDREVGPVHSIFYGAGIRKPKPIDLITEDDWDATLTTHVKGAYLCASAVLPQVRERWSGAIVTLASDHAIVGLADDPAYAAAQTALYALTKSLARAFAGYGVRVNAVGCGAIDSEDMKLKSERARKVPMRRLGQPEEVAAVADFLLSERSAYLTGQIVHVNGGEVSW